MSEKLMCPMLKKDCIEEKCSWFVKSVKNTPPPECKPIQFNVCAIVMIPDMLLDVIRNTSGTQAAVESNRNETVKRQDHMNHLFTNMVGLAIESRERKQLADSEG